MDRNERIRKEAERDRCWAGMRENKKVLQEIIQEKEVEKYDIKLLRDCLKLVLMDIELYEDKFLEKDIEIDEVLKENDLIIQSLSKLNLLSKYLSGNYLLGTTF